MLYLFLKGLASASKGESMYYKIYHDNVVTANHTRAIEKSCIPGIIDTIVSEVIDIKTDYNNQRAIKETLDQYYNLLNDEDLSNEDIEHYCIMLNDILYNMHYDVLITTGKLNGGDYDIIWRAEHEED